MIILQYSTLTKDVQTVKSRLEEMVVTHKVEQADGLQEPLLISDKDRISGKAAILDFLESLNQELQQWYHCACR